MRVQKMYLYFKVQFKKYEYFQSKKKKKKKEFTDFQSSSTNTWVSLVESVDCVYMFYEFG